MKNNFYIMMLLSGSLLQASCAEDQTGNVVRQLTDLQIQVNTFIEQDDQRELDQKQAIKDARTSLLLASAQTLGETSSIGRKSLKEIRQNLNAGLEKVDENQNIIDELKQIKKNHRRKFYFGSCAVADQVLQDEKTSLKNVLKTQLQEEFLESVGKLAPLESQKNLPVGTVVPSAPPADFGDSQN